MIACPRAGCGSSNVELLSLYWQGLPAESPLRAAYAPPPEVEARYWVALAAVAVGIFCMVAGGVLLGVMVAVGGLVFGAVSHRQVVVGRMALAEWSTARICHACSGRF